jgi:RNA polymerase sigma-70 factor (ECF subfamily)
VGRVDPNGQGQKRQDELYEQAISLFGNSLTRLLRAYEADEEKRRDLSQEIHFQLWRSLGAFDGRCSLRTWVFRVAHNTAASYVAKERRTSKRLITLEEMERPSGDLDQEMKAHQSRQLETLAILIQQLKPLDRQVIIFYLEELDARSIAEITGLSTASVAMKIHRIKRILGQRVQEVQSS